MNIMDGFVEIKPRFVDIPPDNPDKLGTSTSELPSTGGGLFVSMYGNKLIIVVIILVVIIIIISAYVLFRKPDEPQKVGSAENTARNREDTIRVTKTTVETKGLQKEEEHDIESKKVEPDTEEVKSEKNNNTIEESQVDPQEPKQEVVTSSTVISISPDTCNEIIQPGRQCKNKIRSGGKCRHHIV